MDQARMKNFKFISAIFLIGITMFSLFRYIIILKERSSLLAALEQEKKQVVSLESEKQGLALKLEQEKAREEKILQENTALGQKLKLSQEKIAKLNTGLGLAKTRIRQLNSRASILKSENIALREEEINLKSQLDQISQENNDLKAKFSPITKFKKVFGGLKTQAHRKADNKDKEGNRGFLVKDGQSTGVNTVKIEVKPAPAP